MGSIVLYMSMSEDGFVTGPNVRPDNAMGDGGMRLHEWVFPKAEPGDMAATGASLKGVSDSAFCRRTALYDIALCHLAVVVPIAGSSSKTSRRIPFCGRLAAALRSPSLLP